MSSLRKIRKKFSRKNKVDPVVENHTITLEGDLSSDTFPHVECTCGWNTDPQRNLMVLGLAAKDHALKTGHKLRQH